ncbi:uncharacterized protein Triagg1_4128 [Trichoderma aggressivum f. europaeum]|uniref:Uncharacterized protein n=1 Tax=Trichoderma aggressivum f. europaeum TaxID=173218 RepID=A0AAE1IIL1_9HYPO|nr:hypothetical protein Triagg1_4128 [Trichoderma aggressivum f. europaeum]
MSTILVTGGNRGIGFGIAQALANRIPSSTIILACRNLASGREAIDQLRGQGISSKLDAVQLDIEDIQSITTAVEAVNDRYGKLDGAYIEKSPCASCYLYNIQLMQFAVLLLVLINNAASLEMPQTQDLAELRDCSNINFNRCVTSNILVTKAFVPLLRKSPWPRVIMNSSARGSLGRTASRELPPVALIDYCVCKAALNMLTLHYQINEDNYKDGGEKITFWSVSPGHTKTAFNNYQGKKDPVDSAEAFVRLLESEKGAIEPGTFWEYETGKFQVVPCRVPPAAAYTTSMPNAPRLTCRTIPVEPGQLPAPATKLVITQVLQASQDSQFWALITVGAFYDSQDRIIWSTEQFAARVGTDSESDEEEEASEAEAETGRESEAELEAEAEATLESATESTIEPSSPPGTLITFILWQFISPYHLAFELATLNRTGNTLSARIEAIITTNRPSLPLGARLILIFAPITTLTPTPTLVLITFLTPIPTRILTSLTSTTSLRPATQHRHHLLAAHLLAGIPSSPVLSQDTGKRPLPQTMSGGWNPLTGRDSGSGRPAYAPYGAPQPAQGQAYIPHAGGPGYSFGTAPQHSAWPNMTYGYYPLAASQGVPQYVVPGAGYPPTQGPTAGYYTQQTYSYQPNGTGNMLPRQPQPYPNIDPTMPAAQMTNTTGGTGCEPGYNYFFPAEHTKAHVFKTNTPPWQLPPTAQIPFKAAHIPCNTTMAELLKGFGCTNATPKKNKCFEVVSGGGGKWYKGLEVNGADKDMLKKTIKDVGWDPTRTGNPNEKPVVCLWFCRD